MNQGLYRITAHLSEDQRHSPFVISGLLELEKESLIEIDFSTQGLLLKNRWIQHPDKPHRSSKGYPWCIELEVTRLKDRKNLRIGIDLQDWEEMYAVHSLKKCDIIFKRAFPANQSELKVLDKIILPFGPNQSARISDNRVMSTWKKAEYLKYLSRVISEPLTSMQKLTKTSPKKSSGSSAQPLFTTEIPTHPFIFFQVQCHTWENNRLSAGLNEMRANLIRKMRGEFGASFVGGMFFSGSIDERYRDCLTNVDPNPENYKKFVKSADIVISTNGFGQSVPWKFMEYLQWGCCTVSEKSVHYLPYSSDNEAFITFVQVEEAIQQCKELMANPERRSAMKQNASAFYEERLQSKVAVLNAVNQAFEILTD